jgi:asparaginyl-tRNA synthetase
LGKIDELQDDVEGLIKTIVSNVLNKNESELKILGRDINKLKPTLEKKFPRITYTDALVY